MRLHQIWTSALIALTVQSGAAFAEVTVSQSNEPQVVLGQQFRSLLGAEHKTIEALPEAERTAHRARFRELLFQVRDQDGTWNDRVFPRSASFGTAMSALALVEAEGAVPATTAGPDATR